jgi:hypothetical protein
MRFQTCYNHWYFHFCLQHLKNMPLQVFCTCVSWVCTDLSTAAFRTWNSVDSSMLSQVNLSQVLPKILPWHSWKDDCLQNWNDLHIYCVLISITKLFMQTSTNMIWKSIHWFHGMPYSSCHISPLHGSVALAVFEPETHSAFCRVVPDQAFMLSEVLSNPSFAKQYGSIFLAGQMKHLWVLV